MIAMVDAAREGMEPALDRRVDLGASSCCRPSPSAPPREGALQDRADIALIAKVEEAEDGQRQHRRDEGELDHRRAPAIAAEGFSGRTAPARTPTLPPDSVQSIGWQGGVRAGAAPAHTERRAVRRPRARGKKQPNHLRQPQSADIVADLGELGDQSRPVGDRRGLVGVARAFVSLAAQRQSEGDHPDRDVHRLGRVAHHLETLVVARLVSACSKRRCRAPASPSPRSRRRRSSGWSGSCSPSVMKMMCRRDRHAVIGIDAVGAEDAGVRDEPGAPDHADVVIGVAVRDERC